GVSYLHEHGILARNTTPMPDDIERLLEKWIREHPRKGLPAPWVSERWKDNDYAQKVICGPDGRLSVEQVLAIRTLATSGVEVAHIAKHVGASNELQVQRVIDGRTYVRIGNSTA